MGRLIQNIGGGGGVSSDEVTATTGDVLKGKTAVTSDSNDEVATGTLELTGNAADADVLEGKTYYNTDAKAKKTGTMPNRNLVDPAVGGINSDHPNTAVHIGTAPQINTSVVSKQSLFSISPKNGYYKGDGGDYASVPVSSVANAAGLTAGKLANGQTVLGVTGTYKGRGNANQSQVRKGVRFSTDTLDNVVGTMNEKGAQTYTPGRSNQTIAASQYLTGAQTILGDADLTAGNIRTGANIFNVAGTYKGLGNAAQANVESGKTFSTASLSNASGSMAVMSGGSYTPSKSAQTISCSGKKMSSNITINAIPSNYSDLSAGATVFKNGTFYNGFAARGKCKYKSGTHSGWPSNEPILWPDPDPKGYNYHGYNISSSTYKETSYGLLKNSTGIVCFSLAKTVNFDAINRIRVTVVCHKQWTSADPEIQLINAASTRRVEMAMTDWGTGNYIMPSGTHTRTFDVSKIKGHWFVNFSVVTTPGSDQNQDCVSNNNRGATEMVFLA